jgi:hypothetical protein
MRHCATNLIGRRMPGLWKLLHGDQLTNRSGGAAGVLGLANLAFTSL